MEKPIANTLSEACAAVLQMSVSELKSFIPRTVAEQIAVDYAWKASRGDDAAFNMLTATSDSFVIDQNFEDTLTKALEELGKDLVNDYVDRHKTV